MERQVQVQQGGRRARTYGRALLRQRFIPSIIWAIAGGAADGGVLVGDLAIQNELGGGIVDGLFVSQEGHHALLQRAKAAFDLAFGLRTGCHQMGHAQGGKGALEFRTGITVIGHGIVAKEA